MLALWVLFFLSGCIKTMLSSPISSLHTWHSFISININNYAGTVGGMMGMIQPTAFNCKALPKCQVRWSLLVLCVYCTFVITVPTSHMGTSILWCDNCIYYLNLFYLLPSPISLQHRSAARSRTARRLRCGPSTAPACSSGTPTARCCRHCWRWWPSCWCRFPGECVFCVFTLCLLCIVLNYRFVLPCLEIFLQEAT